jgi:hypothetical protein
MNDVGGGGIQKFKLEGGGAENKKEMRNNCVDSRSTLSKIIR